MKIGVFGGTFNPPHLGHKRIAMKFKQMLSLDKVLIIPTFQPPHKQAKQLLSCEQRLELCRLCFDEPFFEISDIEIQRQGKSYTFDTLSQLTEIYKDSELYLIIGSDMLLTFHQWYRYDDILKMCKICTTTREEEISIDELKQYSIDVLGKDESKNEIFFIKEEAFECSSTEIREKIRLNENLESLLSGKVIEFFKQKEEVMQNLEQYKKLLSEILTEKRLEHTLNVADSSRELAKLYHEDEEKAYLAGLLHDIMKNTDENKQLQIMQKDGIILSMSEKNNQKLWHAMSGSSYIKLELGINDEQILNAVRYHTTGRAGMSKFEKIVYIADFISAERNYPDVSKMRELANISLEKAALYALKFSITNLAKQNFVIHTDSVEFYNELICERINIDD